MAAQTTKSTRRGESTYHTRAVSRACQLLLAFSVDDFELSIADLHKKLGIHKSTLFRKVKAITSEAKFSGTFLSFFPILCLVGINVTQPDYYADVIDTPAFIPACAVVAVMLAVNMIFMRMMVNIKV